MGDDSRKNTYFGATSITIDHPLSEKEFQDLKTILLSFNNIGQVYFKGNVNIETINKVKYILEISPAIDDNEVDKYLLLDKELVDSMITDTAFNNPDTWKISYIKNNNYYEVTELSKYRKMETYFESIMEDTSNIGSQLEKIMYVYDKMKKITVRENIYNDRFPEIITERRGSSVKINELFSLLLTKLDIANTIFQYTNSADKNKNIVMAKIDDSKYDVAGMYFFEPTIDGTLEENSKTSNYNFFGITGEQLKCYKKLGTVQRILGMYTSENIDDFNHKLNYNIMIHEQNKIEIIESTFSMESFELYKGIMESRKLTSNDIYHVYLSKHQEKASYMSLQSEQEFKMNYNTNTNTQFHKSVFKVKMI